MRRFVRMSFIILKIGGGGVPHLQECVDLYVRRREPSLLVTRKAVRVDTPPLGRDDSREDGRYDEWDED